LNILKEFCDAGDALYEGAHYTSWYWLFPYMEGDALYEGAHYTSWYWLFPYMEGDALYEGAHYTKSEARYKEGLELYTKVKHQIETLESNRIESF